MHAYMKEFRDIICSSMVDVQKSRGYTQEMMAEKLKITPHSYNLLANGKYCPSTTTFVFLLGEMGIEQAGQLFDNLNNHADQLDQREDISS